MDTARITSDLDA